MTPTQGAARRQAILLWAFAAGLLGVLPVSASPPLPEALFGTHWYTVTILGTRSGYSCQSLTRLADGVQTTERTVLRVRLGAETLTAERTERRRYDDSLRLLEIDHHANQIGRRMTVRAVRQGKRLQVSRQDPEGERRTELAVPDDFGGDLAVLQVLAAGQMELGWEKTFSTFDADLGRLDRVRVQAREHLVAPEACWLFTAHSELLDLPTKLWVNQQGLLLRQEVPGMMDMTLTLATEQEALAEVTPALLSTAIPVITDMPRAHDLKLVRLRASAPVGDVFTAIPATSRQQVRRDGAAVLVEVRAETPPKTAQRLPITDPAVQEYLKASQLAQSDDPALRKQARAIIGAETDSWQAACRLMAWVHRKLRKVESEPRPVSALEVLKMGSGDCTEHAILLAALAQSVGLPSRVAAGLVYDASAYHYHAWNEVFVGRWVEMDPTWGQETVDAGHLQIARGALDSAAMARLSLASARTMGNLDLDVLHYR